MTHTSDEPFAKGVYNHIEIKRGRSEFDKDVLSNSNYMRIAFAMDNAPPMRLKSSHQARCRCCNNLEYEYHIYEPIPESEAN